MDGWTDKWNNTQVNAYAWFNDGSDRDFVCNPKGL